MTTMTETHRQITGGVDTHRDVNVVAALDERGTEVGVESFPTTASGYRCATTAACHPSMPHREPSCERGSIGVATA